MARRQPPYEPVPMLVFPVITAVVWRFWSLDRLTSSVHVATMQVLDILADWEEHAGRLDAKTYNVALSALGKCGRYGIGSVSNLGHDPIEWATHS